MFQYETPQCIALGHWSLQYEVYLDLISPCHGMVEIISPCQDLVEIISPCQDLVKSVIGEFLLKSL